MSEAILSLFEGESSYLSVFLVSILPIIELRGAVPFGIGMGLDWRLVYLVSVIGNVLPAPFIVLFLRKILDFLKTTKYFSGFANWLHDRSMKKAKDVTKYKMLGLFLFVAIPLPGTGAWTGSAIAALLNMRLKDALPSIVLGVICAGILMLGISYGFVELFQHLF